MCCGRKAGRTEGQCQNSIPRPLNKVCGGKITRCLFYEKWTHLIYRENMSSRKLRKGRTDALGDISVQLWVLLRNIFMKTGQKYCTALIFCGYLIFLRYWRLRQKARKYKSANIKSLIEAQIKMVNLMSR